MNFKNVKIIAFDADDTLWVNEPYYQECEKIFCKLLENYLPSTKISEELLKTEIQNIDLYGYGAKGFMLSMIETAIRITNNNVSIVSINEIIKLGKELIERPIELLGNTENILSCLKKSYKLILATKGDLLDQQRKLKKSGLFHLFDHIEIMSDKKESDYIDLLRKLELVPSDFLMIGNSIKSDIIPVLAIGGHAIYIPFHTTWQHEVIDENIIGNYYQVSKFSEILNILQKV